MPSNEVEIWSIWQKRPFSALFASFQAKKGDQGMRLLSPNAFTFVQKCVLTAFLLTFVSCFEAANKPRAVVGVESGAITAQAKGIDLSKLESALAQVKAELRAEIKAVEIRRTEVVGRDKNTAWAWARNVGLNNEILTGGAGVMLILALALVYLLWGVIKGYQDAIELGRDPNTKKFAAKTTAYLWGRIFAEHRLRKKGYKD